MIRIDIDVWTILSVALAFLMAWKMPTDQCLVIFAVIYWWMSALASAKKAGYPGMYD